MARLHVELVLREGLEAALPAGAARHVQVLRLQPGAGVTLFDGGGCDWPAEILSIGRSEVRVRVAAPRPVDRELPLAVTLAIGMPANERMDWLVEKATELGVAGIQPLQCERSVLRLDGERAERRRAHWEAVAIAAAEQCGRARVPALRPVRRLADWLAEPSQAADARFVLSLAEGARPFCESLKPALQPGSALVLLSGPEGGLTEAEDRAARAAGWQPLTLGPRVLRAETAPLAVLGALTALFA